MRLLSRSSELDKTLPTLTPRYVTKSPGFKRLLPSEYKISSIPLVLFISVGGSKSMEKVADILSDFPRLISM